MEWALFQLEERINLPFILPQERFLDYFRIKGFVVFILLSRKSISLLAFFGSQIAKMVEIFDQLPPSLSGPCARTCISNPKGSTSQSCSRRRCLCSGGRWSIASPGLSWIPLNICCRTRSNLLAGLFGNPFRKSIVEIFYAYGKLSRRRYEMLYRGECIEKSPAP